MIIYKTSESREKFFCPFEKKSELIDMSTLDSRRKALDDLKEAQLEKTRDGIKAAQTNSTLSKEIFDEGGLKILNI